MADEPNIEGSSHEQRVVIARAYDHFHATAVWPTFGQLDRPLISGFAEATCHHVDEVLLGRIGLVY